MNLPYTGVSFIVKFYETVINTIFPRNCLICGHTDVWICHQCQEECLKIQSPTCPFCDRLSPLGKTCSRCRQKYALNGLRAAWYYKEPIVSIIKKIKYHHQFAVVEDILPRLTALYNELPIPPYVPVIITSVPSHSLRLQRYGYNQSEILAQALARTINKPYRPFLKRLKSVSQTKLGRNDRFLAAEKQFQSRGPIESKPTVVIIDDVVTTGATLATCAQKLKQSGAKSVWAITIAKD
jgi:ComF family protein